MTPGTLKLPEPEISRRRSKMSSTVYNSGSQPFLARGTLNMRKKLSAHLYFFLKAYKK